MLGELVPDWAILAVVVLMAIGGLVLLVTELWSSRKKRREGDD